MATNRERINNMTNEELAEMLGKQDCQYCIHKVDDCYRSNSWDNGDCPQGILQWLNQESER